jgi:hypothetical protein
VAVSPTAYIETTVVSYLVARPSRDLIVAGHQAITVEWWEKQLPKLSAFVSPVVLDEAGAGDSEMTQRRMAALETMGVLELTQQVRSLAEAYFAAIGMPDAARADALHLALATAHGMDYLVTWNCRHIANGNVRRIVRQVNADRGIETPVICTPEELMEF